MKPSPITTSLSLPGAASRKPRLEFQILTTVALFLIVALLLPGAADASTKRPKAAKDTVNAGPRASSGPVDSSGSTEAAFLDQPLLLDDPARSGARWMGPDGLPLPLTEAEILDFLATAPVVARKQLSSGINRPEKITLEKDGIVANAIFRTVQIERSSSPRPQLDRFLFRDSYRHEVAAYRLSRLLGVDRVPPVVLREIDGRSGSVQLWVEDTRTEGELIQGPLARINAGRRFVQRQQMLAFDQLIYNFDRHAGNRLYDDGGVLWYIDHTRSFKRVPEIPGVSQLAVVDEVFLDRLRSLGRDEISAALEDHLGKMELSALLKRRALLLEHLQGLISERGQAAVVVDLRERLSEPAFQFEMPAPEPPAADRNWVVAMKRSAHRAVVRL